jgi:hypothetical protein
MRTFLVLMVLLTACASAPPKPEPFPEFDAGAPLFDCGRDVYANACSNLASLGCAEGNSTNCAEVMRHAHTSRLILIRPDCLAVARSKPMARVCGGVTCP